MTRRAHRVRDGNRVVYVTPFEEHGRRVVYRQDLDDFATVRETVSVSRARTLAERGSEVELYETPAWADARVPAADSGIAQPP